MEFVTLNNGVKMPILGLGTWDLRGKQCEKIVAGAIDEGYRLIDTAQMYQNEIEVGRGIKKSGIKREKLFITTKLYSPSRSYKLAQKGIDESLRNLGLDYIDLMLIHEPYSEASEMYGALEEAYREGKLRAIGVSNFKESFYKNFISSCTVVPAVNQVEAHVYFAQKNLQKVMAKYGTQLEAWAPFTEGRKNIFAEPLLKEIGRAHGKTSAQIALKYLVQKNIIVIPKSSKIERLRENINIFDFALSDEEMQKIGTLDDGKSLFGWY